MEKREKEKALTTERVYQLILSNGAVKQEHHWKFRKLIEKINNSNGEYIGLMCTKIVYYENGTTYSKGERFFLRGEVVSAKELDAYLALRGLKRRSISGAPTSEEKSYVVTVSGIVVPKSSKVKILPFMFLPGGRK